MAPSEVRRARRRRARRKGASTEQRRLRGRRLSTIYTMTSTKHACARHRVGPEQARMHGGPLRSCGLTQLGWHVYVRGPHGSHSRQPAHVSRSPESSQTWPARRRPPLAAGNRRLASPPPLITALGPLSLAKSAPCALTNSIMGRYPLTRREAAMALLRCCSTS